MLEPDGAYCAAFSSRCAIAVAVRRGSSRTGTSGSTWTLEPVRLQGVFDLVPRGGDDLRRMRPPGFGGNRAGVDASHVEDVLEQAGQAFGFRQDQVALLEPFVGCQRGRLDVARGDADGRERRAQVMPQRSQQRGLELLALARQLGCLALLEKRRALDGDGDHAAKRVQRAGLDRAAGRGKQADGPCSDAQRYEADRTALHRHRAVAGIGSLPGIELE